MKSTPVIKEIFNSISGEVSPFHQGRLTTFVRFADCPVGCSYCDTDYANGVQMSWMKLISEINEKYEVTGALCVTGGEPLLYENIGILSILYDNVWIETSGCVPFNHLIGKANLVVDFKCSETKLKPQDIKNFQCLKETDFVKFLIGSYEDFETAARVSGMIRDKSPVQIAFSSVYDKVPTTKLLEWLNDFQITNVIMNFQLHKLVGAR